MEPIDMRKLLALALFLLFSTPSHAELRIIGVRVTKNADFKPRVSIHSDVDKEDKRDLKVEDASKIMREAQGWGSSVMVGVVAHDVPVREYLPLLSAISENAWLDLAFVEGEKPNFIFDNIKKKIEADAGAKPR
jgi:hypothetical protein